MRCLLRAAAWALFLAGHASGCGAADEIGSIGAVMVRDNTTGGLFVRDVPPHLGAAEAQVLAGDEILMIDGHYVRSMSAEQVRQRLRGPSGTSVQLTLVRGAHIVRVDVLRSTGPIDDLGAASETISE